MTLKIRIFIGLLLCHLVSQAQTEADSSNIQRDTVHSVKTATLLSTFVPGAGQIYNHIAQPKGQKKGFWKVPLVYAAVGGTAFMLYNNQLTVNELKSEVLARRNQTTSNPNYAGFSDEGVLTLYNQSAQSRDFSILLLILSYGIQVADAAVEAHFVNFDISEDLSLGISPWVHPNRTPQASQIGFGMGFHLNFR